MHARALTWQALGSWKRAGAVLCLRGIMVLAAVSAEEAAVVWTERETRLANEYLGLLVAQPEPGRVLDLLWQLYETHGQTQLLLDTIAAQAAAQPHPSVRLVQAHLLARGGDAAAAGAIFEAVAAAHPENAQARRAAARAAAEAGEAARALGHYEALAKLLPEGGGERVTALLEAGDTALGAEQVERAADLWEQAAAAQAESLDLARQVARRLLQAGLSGRAAVFFKALAERAEPREKLAALRDLARIQAHADQFEEADAALRQGLELTHFRDGRHAELFRERVRLHERFGRLEEMRAALEAAAEQAAPSGREAALHELAVFFSLTVNPEARLAALRRLLELAPQEESYRWEWARALLDQGGVEEARAWLDAHLEAAGARVASGWVLLRCETDLRAGDPAAAERRLLDLVAAAAGRAEVEKEALAFARLHALDTAVETLLRARVARQPDKAEPVFELAGHLRARRQTEAAQAVLDAYAAGAVKTEEQRRRLAEVTTFLAGGNDLAGALERARAAAALSQAGREEWLRLADLLADHGDDHLQEARALLEKAWQAAANDEERVEADERLLALLHEGALPASAAGAAAGAEFRLPSVFTGSQFASDEPAPGAGATPQLRQELERIVARARESGAPEWRFRAAWWALRAEDLNAAYEHLRALAFDPESGATRELSLEAENVLLELAQSDDNRALAQRVLERLRQRDPGNRTRYLLREVELLLEADQQRRDMAARRGEDLGRGAPEPVGGEAVTLLRAALRQDAGNDLLLAALSRILVLQRRPEEALALWQQAAARASGAAAIPLLERQAELQLSLSDLPGHVATGMRVVELETEVGRRREAFKRFLDRLTAADSSGRELDPAVLEERLELVAAALTAAAARHPFDGFYPEALAQVHLRADDAPAAFAAMKRAYYTAPDTPFSLEQLRDAALRVEDVALAIYFQKQIAAAAAQGEVARENRLLVELLERDFRIDEADQARQQLERRFAQDVKALEGLAKHYQETGQDEARRRVLEQVTRVQSWDGRARLELALACVKLGEHEAARGHLQALLAATPAGFKKVPVFPAVPLPLSEKRHPGKRGPATDVSDLLGSVNGLEEAEQESLRAFLSQPRAEYALLPEAPEMQRLRALEELGRLQTLAGEQALAAWQKRWLAAAEKNPVEALWALHGAPPPESVAWPRLVDRLLGKVNTLEADFARVWLLLRGGQMAALLDWIAPMRKARPEAEAERLRRLLTAGVLALADVPAHRFTDDEMTRLAESGQLPNTALLEITRRLHDRRRFDPALTLGEWLRQRSRALGADYALMLANMAEAAERRELARHYLKLAVQIPTKPGKYQGVYDPFLHSVGALARTAASRQERDEALALAWEHLQKAPPSDLTELRRAAVAGLAGAQPQAVERLERWVREDFLGNRSLGQKPGGLMPQGSMRFEEAPQAQSLWEETREIGALLAQQGLAGVSAEAERRLLERWGTVQLGPRPGYEFNELRLAGLLRSLRQTDHANRLRLIRNWLAPVDMRAESSVELLAELGAKLESAGMAREAIEVYRLLPPRAPTNSEYAVWLLRATEAAREIEPGKSFAIQLARAVPPFKPPTPGDEALREMHARFLAADFDLESLRLFAAEKSPAPILPGRLPPETFYLREQARLLERLGRADEALTAWEKYRDCFLLHDDDGLEPDTESALCRARILHARGDKTAALAVLREHEHEGTPGEHARAALLLETQLTAEQQDVEGLRRVMTRAVKEHEASSILAVAEVLRATGNRNLADNLLTQAERRASEPAERFRLRAEQLRMQVEPSAKPTSLPPPEILLSVLRAGGREAESERLFLDWLAELAAATPAAAAAEWTAFLRAQTASGPDRVLAAAALCAWSAPGSVDGFNAALNAWRDAARNDDDRRCIEQAAVVLLRAGRAKEAWAAAEFAGELSTLRRQGRRLPVMVGAARALGQEHTLRELFSEVVHQSPPGGERLNDWVAAFEQAGRPEWARELFEGALRHAENHTGPEAALSAAWVRFLIRQRAFMEAESFLLAHDFILTGALPDLLSELFTAWGRLADLPAQVKRYRLAGGIEKEVLWRAGAVISE